MNRPHDPLAMPPEAPLAMPVQQLGRRPARALPPRREPGGVYAARAFVFGFAFAVVAALAFVLRDWFQRGGLDPIELGILGLAVFTAFWIALSVGTALLGCLPGRGRHPRDGPPLDIAMLLPIYGEPAERVAAHAGAILADLARCPLHHRLTLYILSDTRDTAQVARQRQVFRHLATLHPHVPLHYRHRARNTRFKAGNVEDWVRRWGGTHDAMLVLDADSVMGAAAIGALADEMAGNPRLGLLQTVPRLIGARTLFARAQAFANTVYGGTMARGLSLWSAASANYWGHNALIRLPAFAAAAGLPDLPGRRPFGGVILSHDFVEAALMRRSGWEVRFHPEIEQSYETTPADLIGHVRRDRRWCQGNLQHLRVVGARGLHPLSRVHLLHGAMAYLASLGWFGLVVLWVLAGSGQADGAWRYFSEANPMFPAWPEMDLVSRVLILGLIYGMLVAPKVLGALRFWAGDPRLTTAGGPLAFCASWLIELALSVLLAPSLMVQHIRAIARTALGRDTGWAPAAEGLPGWPGLLRFHWAELLLGAAMLALFAQGALSLWLVPIAGCLIAAPLLTWATARPMPPRLLATPQETRPPEVLAGLEDAASAPIPATGTPAPSGP